MKHKSLILLAIVAGAIMTIGPASAQSAGDITLAGAEDDADDCCSKCAEDEACATTPTGCECWVPDTDDVAGGGAGGSKLSGGAQHFAAVLGAPRNIRLGVESADVVLEEPGAA